MTENGAVFRHLDGTAPKTARRTGYLHSERIMPPRTPDPEILDQWLQPLRIGSVILYATQYGLHTAVVTNVKRATGPGRNGPAQWRVVYRSFNYGRRDGELYGFERAGSVGYKDQAEGGYLRDVQLLTEAQFQVMHPEAQQICRVVAERARRPLHFAQIPVGAA